MQDNASSPIRITIFMFTSSNKKLIFLIEEANALVVAISQTCTVLVKILSERQRPCDS